MIKIENTETVGWKAAIRGMRNPMNSWSRSDSYQSDFTNNGKNGFVIGNNDYKLMMQLAKGGSVHAKYRRMITVYVDVTAPLYWWKEYDTYKVGTVANSCSTMHTIHKKEFTLNDFSYEHLVGISLNNLQEIIAVLNHFRKLYIETNDKKYWWQIIQLLPSSYNQKRTLMLNYEVLTNIYHSRKTHKLDEWREFCEWIEKLPYSEIIIGIE